MNAPPQREAPSAGKQTGRKRLIAEYHVLAFFAKMFGEPFWFWEQKRTRLMDRIDNERDDQ